ncbi:response regulator [Candidatus Hydrogenedentota bacterium]
MDTTMDTATRVLVVDDEPLVVMSCDRALGAEGMTVEGTGTGHEGLRQVQRGGYDIVLLDIKLPDVDGIDILRRIKKARIETSVVIITGYPSERTATEAMEYGASDYVVKPFSPDELKMAVTRALEHTEPRSEPAPQPVKKTEPRRAPELGLCRSIRTTTRNSEKVVIVGLNGALDSRAALRKTLVSSLTGLHLPISSEYGRHEVAGTEIFRYLENNDRVVIVANAQLWKKPGQFVSIGMGDYTSSEEASLFEVPQIGLPHLFSWTTAVEMQSNLVVVGVQPDEKGKFFTFDEAVGLAHEVMRQAFQEKSWYRHQSTRGPTRRKD